MWASVVLQHVNKWLASVNFRAVHRISVRMFLLFRKGRDRAQAFVYSLKFTGTRKLRPGLVLYRTWDMTMCGLL